jgi:hypothetical protein
VLTETKQFREFRNNFSNWKIIDRGHFKTVKDAVCRVELLAGRPGFESWQGQVSVLQKVQTGSGAHTASYPKGTGGDIPGGKEAEA